MFDPTLFHDRYEEAVVAMLNEKRAGLPVSKQRELPRVVDGTDLMSALRQSIEKAKEAESKAAAVTPKGKKTPKRNADQREMLLPIAGGGSREAAEKQP
jgi:DNA end-binding protein Ku